MIVSNAMSVLGRFFTFNIAGAVIALYEVGFGIVIVILESPIQIPVVGDKLKTQYVRVYAKFLDLTIGRGFLYLFVGTLQISNLNMIDWAVGGFMVFVGVTAIVVGYSSTAKLRNLKRSISTETQLKSLWSKYDRDKNGTLDAKELTEFVKEADPTTEAATAASSNNNEIAAVFLSLDKNFDDRISYEEFYAWWVNATM